jgi:hypothetical protein
VANFNMRVRLLRASEVQKPAGAASAGTAEFTRRFRPCPARRRPAKT